MISNDFFDSVLKVGKNFKVSFERTLRVPDDGKEYPLPPSLGEFPIFKVKDFKDRVPKAWLEHPIKDSYFIPMYQREALWVSFDTGTPTAVKIGLGRIDVLTGKKFSENLNKTKANQNYLVAPDQPWLDGINSGNDVIRQFVAMPIGMGYTIEEQLGNKEPKGTIQIRVFEAKPGKFPKPDRRVYGKEMVLESCCESPAMGLGAGGAITQKIYPDDYGYDTWDPDNSSEARVFIVNSMDFREITGYEALSTPVSAQQYNDYGFPWFELYDETEKDVAPGSYAKVKSIKQMDKKKGFAPQQDDSSLNPENVIGLKLQSVISSAGQLPK